MRAQMEARLREAEHDDHYRALGVSRSASRDQVHEAFLRLARTFHPDRFASGALIELRPTAERVFERITEAHETLFDPERRRQYDAAVDAGAPGAAAAPAPGEALLDQGRAALRRGELPAAIRTLRAAVAQDARHGPARAVLARALFLVARERIPPEVKPLLSDACRLSPDCVEAWFTLGQVLAAEGDLDGAERALRRALALDPAHHEAARDLRLLASRRSRTRSEHGWLDRFRNALRKRED